MKPAIWKTRDGTTIPVREMGDSHLLNSIRLIERQYRAQCLDEWAIVECAYPDGEPEGAAMAAQSEARFLETEADEMEHIDEHIPTHKHLVKEANRRRLELLPL